MNLGIERDLLGILWSEKTTPTSWPCGVGVKVARCVVLFGLHQLNAFPIDVWVKRILENEYRDGYPYEQYAPYNGVYQQYMFAYYRKAVME